MKIEAEEERPKKRQLKPEPETPSLPSSELVELPSVPEAPVPVPSPQPDGSFIGLDWNQLPHGVVKAARNGGPSIITGQVECVECKRMMWACNPQLENLCEYDDYWLRHAVWERRAQQAKSRPKTFDPFREGDELIRSFWPKG